MNLKSKSLLFKSIIEKVDEQLYLLPTFEAGGTSIEDSENFSMYVDSLTNLTATDGEKTIHPVGETLATALIYDEIEERKELNDEKEK